MAKAKAPKAKKIEPQKPSLRPLTDKESTFLREYFKCMNATEAAIRAFDCSTRESAASVGYETLKKLQPHVAAWLDEEGLSERYLKEKLLEGLDATEVKVFNAAGVSIEISEEGEKTYVPGQIIYSEPLISWAPRGAFLKLAMQSKGMLVDKSEVNHKGQVGVTFRVDLPPDLLTALGSISTALLKTRFKE